MKKHIKNYLKAIDAGEQDIILCERCAFIAVDIHHITFKGQGGSDEYENLIALCRGCHDKAHTSEITKEELYEIKDLTA